MLFKEKSDSNFNFNDEQRQVIEYFATGGNKIFFEGAIRAGKSMAICWLIDYLCSHTVGQQAYIFRNTFESIKKDTHQIFMGPKGWALGKARFMDNKHKLYYPETDSTIHFMHAKSADLSGATQGITAGIVFFEQLETISEEDYDIIRPRLSQWGPDAILKYKERYKDLIAANKLLVPKNYLFMTANPKAGWLKSRFIDTYGIPDLVKGDQIKVMDELKKDGIKRISTSIYGNLKNLGPDYEALVKNASTAFKKQYFDGEWSLNTGIIYEEFNSMNIEDGGHVTTEEWEKKNEFDPAKYKTVLAIDPGYVKSKMFGLFAAILPDKSIYLFDEVVANGKSKESYEKIGPDEFSKELKRKFKDWAFEPKISLIDPAAHDPNAGLGSISGQFIKNGIHVISATKIKEYDSIMGLKSLFKNRKVLVANRCQQFIRELGLFRWDERKVLNGDQKPVDDDNDGADCLRYIYNLNPSPNASNEQYLENYKKHLDPQNQLKGFLKEMMPKKTKKKKNNLSWGV